MKKSLAVAVASGIVASAVLASAAPAYAAIDFSTATWTVGGINYEFENNTSNAYMGSLQYMTTASQSNYIAYYANEFYVDGGDVGSGYPMCIGSTATESTDAVTGDVTISCAATQVGSSDVYVSGETRLYSDTPLARNIWTYENRGANPIDLGSGTNHYEYLNFTPANEATSSNATSCATIQNSDNWTLQADSSDTMILGFAWQAAGQSAYDISNGCEDDYYYLYVGDSVIPAGATVHFMTFQYSPAPADATQGAMDTAFAAAKTDMAMFDALDDKLCRGISDGTAVYGWGTCTASTPDPELPNTGSDSAQSGLLAAGAAVLALAGVALTVVRRRRTA